MTPDDIRAYAPERILAWPAGIQPASGGAGLWCDVPEFSRFGVATEYIRADLHAAQIAALEARVRELERQVDDAWSEYYKETSIPGTTNYKGYIP